MRIPLVYNERSRFFVNALNNAISKLEDAQKAITYLPLTTADYLPVSGETAAQARHAAQEEVAGMAHMLGLLVQDLQECRRVLVARSVTERQKQEA